MSYRTLAATAPDCSNCSLLDVTTRVNHLLASPIVLLSFLPTVANARAAARRDLEEYFVLETMVAVVVSLPQIYGRLRNNSEKKAC